MDTERLARTLSIIATSLDEVVSFDKLGGWSRIDLGSRGLDASGERWGEYLLIGDVDKASRKAPEGINGVLKNSEVEATEWITINGITVHALPASGFLADGKAARMCWVLIHIAPWKLSRLGAGATFRAAVRCALERLCALRHEETLSAEAAEAEAGSLLRGFETMYEPLESEECP
jgi:hypothetical protein